jgi:hypothetical protein
MISYFVRYTGACPNGQAFAEYYEQKHAPILRDLTGIRSLILHHPLPWRDPYEVKQGGSFFSPKWFSMIRNNLPWRYTPRHGRGPARISPNSLVFREMLRTRR